MPSQVSPPRDTLRSHGNGAAADAEIDVVDDDCFGATDEVKIYKDEGDQDDEKPENLSEEKFGLIETEECKTSDSDTRNLSGDENSNGFTSSVKVADYQIPFGYPLLPSFPYHPNYSASAKIIGPNNAAAAAAAVAAAAAGFGFYMYGGGSGPGGPCGGEHNGGTKTHSSPSLIVGRGTASYQPPPAHTGIQHLYIDSKTVLPRHSLPSPLYASSSSHIPSCLDLLSRASVDVPSSPFHMHASHHRHPVVPPASATMSPSSIRTSLQAWFTDPSRPSPMNSFGRTVSPPMSLALRLGSSPNSADSSEGCRRPINFRLDSGGHTRSGGDSLCLQMSADRCKEYVKKPLNAFMLFMKECRQRVIEECTLKESAAINQILGRKWHALGRAEQAKYYEMARKEKELHMKIHPGWSARDNYATHTKKKKQHRVQHQQQQSLKKIRHFSAHQIQEHAPTSPIVRNKEDFDRCVDRSSASFNSRFKLYRRSDHARTSSADSNRRHTETSLLSTSPLSRTPSPGGSSHYHHRPIVNL